MGTRYEDQPVEQWSGPESLDPTPVWKQYLLVALLLFAGLAVVVAVSVMALAPAFVTPPALVPGDRLVLAARDVTRSALLPQRIGAPLLDDQRAFWLAQMKGGSYYAMRASWVRTPGETACEVRVDATSGDVPKGFVADCGPVRGTFRFSASGSAGSGSRDLDQYLVSVSGDRVIVNLSRVIQANERTGGPVPTGIPRPRR